RVRHARQSGSGVAEVASLAGYVRQYQVLLDPARLLAYGVTARQLIAAVRGANQDVGARTVEVAGSDYAIRGLGYFRGVEDIEKVAVGVGKDGRSVRVGDVARVTIGPDLRLGIAERNGRGEAVGGVVVMRYGENALRVIDGVKQRIAEIAPALPAGVRIVPTYDRSDLIHGSIKTLWRTLLEESVIVALVCAVFLLHARSALVAIATLPLGILVSLAVTQTFAMAAAALLSVTLVPALMGWFVKGKIRAEAENPLNRWAIRVYRPVLRWAIGARWLVLGGAAGLLLLTLVPLARLGSE